MNKRNALLSVYSKDGIVAFARELVDLGFNLISSGGTAQVLIKAGLAVRDVAEFTKLPPILGHRVVTLAPQIHGGLLAAVEMQTELNLLGYPWIDLVCVDLYPLEQKLRRGKATRDSVIEMTDIGGPALLRSGAKGRRIVICDPTDREPILAWIKEGEPNREEFLNQLAAKAEGIVAAHCLASARYHSDGAIEGRVGTRAQVCGYGENAWQTPAGFYAVGEDDLLSLQRFRIVAGKTPSYNNFCDLDRLLQTATHIASAFCLNQKGTPEIALGVKHGNACGASVGYVNLMTDDRRVVRRRCLQRMVEGDPRALFGGFVGVNFTLDEECAETLLKHGMSNGRRLLDGIMAPNYTPGAVKMLERKGDKCRLLANPALDSLNENSLDRAPRFRYVRGGWLQQPNYMYVPELEGARRQALERNGNAGETADTLASDLATLERDMLLAWAVGATSNSNTITLAMNGQLIGNGVGQQDHMSACQLAIRRARDAGHVLQGAVAYSDSFFPFPDGPEALAAAGIAAILASSGSIRDAEVQKTCCDKGVLLYLVPDQVGRGFYGH